MQRRSEPELMDLEEEAAAYAAADFRDVNAKFVDAALRCLAPLGDGLKVVDLGCGPADIPIRIIEARRRWQVVAVDASQAMIDIAAVAVARRAFEPQIDLVLADAKSTGLPDGEFDAAVSNSILHHVSDPAAFWLEVKRLVPPGGMVFLRDLHRPESVAEVRRIVSQYAGSESWLLQEEFHRSLVAAYTVDEVRAQLAGVGLLELAVERSSDRHLDVFGRLN